MSRSKRPDRKRRTDTPTAVLTVAGDNEVRDVLLDPKGVIIGRDSKCDVVLASNRVSRRHARVFQDPFGRWIIEDLGSRAGTLISGERVRAHALLPGEKIAIGPFVLCLAQPSGQMIPRDPTESSTSILVEGPADLQVVRRAANAEAVLPRVWLQELNQISDRLAQLSGPAELYPEVCRCLATAPGTAALVLRLPHEPAPLPAAPDVLAVRIGGDSEHAPPAELPNLHVSRRVLETIRSRGEAVLAQSVHDADGDFTLTIRDERSPRAVLCAPVSDGAEAFDALYVDVPPGDGVGEIFEFVRAVARQVQFARKSLLLAELNAERRVLDHQLALARNIQAKLTPSEMPDVPGVEVALRYEPAMWVGGDYCDVWVVPDGRLAFVVADVSGKGLSAAMGMANLQAALRTAANFCDSAADVIAHVNEHLTRSLTDNMFVTLFFGLYNSVDGRLDYVNAGHIPPLSISADGEVRSLGPPRDGVLGIHTGRFTGESTTLAQKASLVLVTDGITEARSVEDEEFGTDRLGTVLAKGGRCSARRLVESVIKASARFSGGRSQHDDITILALVRRQLNGVP